MPVCEGCGRRLRRDDVVVVEDVRVMDSKFILEAKSVVCVFCSCILAEKRFREVEAW